MRRIRRCWLLREHSGVLDEAIGLAEEFAALVRERELERLFPGCSGRSLRLQRFKVGGVSLPY